MSWGAVLWQLALGLLAGWGWLALCDPPGGGVAAWRRLAAFVLFCAAAATMMSFVTVAAIVDKTALLPELPARETAIRMVFCAGLSVAARALLIAGQAPSGLALGGLAGFLGWSGYQWLVCARAWRVLGWFSGPFTETVLAPLLVAASIFVALVLAHEGWRPVRLRVLGILLLAWAAPPALALKRLENAWGYGPASLARAAGVPAAAEAEEFAVAWLRPFGEDPYRLEVTRAAAGRLDASAESLERLEAFLKSRRFRHIFWREGVQVLRRGWLSRWDAERALDAAALREPGLFPPDYRTALALLRAGPVTIERYQRLEALAESAEARREGFESVNESQLVFEAFSAAYARFGDEDGARRWLYLVDRLWPIYDKRIEATPLESFHEGEIEGRLFVDGVPAQDVRVGLFFIASSSQPAGALSSSVLPGEDGVFRFSRLGAGRYYLALRAPPARLRGRIEGAPGFIALSADEPAVRLSPIRVERSSSEGVEEGAKLLHNLERYPVPPLEGAQPAFKPRTR